MALKFIVLFGFLAAANAGDLTHGYIGYEPTIAKTIEYAPATVAKTIEYAAPATLTKAIYQPSPILAKTVYEPNYHHHNYHAHPYHHHETVSHYGKTIATPHSYVNKYDTRIINEEPHHHYKVAAYPTIVKAPIAPIIKAAPIVAAAPIVKSYQSLGHAYDGHSYDHSYDHSYAHAAPVLAKAAVAYSPAVAVSHATFESAHGNYAW